MKLKTCEYCGTEYNSELPSCPLCGKVGEAAPGVPEGRKSRAKGGARLAPKGEKAQAPQRGRAAKLRDPDKVPRWMWALICAFLGLAVLIGAVYFVYIMGFFSKPSDSQSLQQSQEQSQVSDETNDAASTGDEEDNEAEPDDDTTTGVPCTSLTLSADSLSLDTQNGHVFLTAVSRPADCTDTITFASSDESVVTINENGMITAVGPGEAEILVTCGSITERCSVLCDFEVQEPDETQDPDADEPDETDETDTDDTQDATGASLSSTDFTLFRPGEKTTLTVRNAPAGATITYTSSNAGVVTVTNSGVVTAVGSGTATITVMVDSVKLTCIARCNLGDSTEEGDGSDTEPDTTYALSHTDVTLFSSGESFQITVSPTPGSVSWASSNSAVCTVDSGGTVTAVGSGTANVTATINGKTYTCIVRCGF